MERRLTRISINKLVIPVVCMILAFTSSASAKEESEKRSPEEVKKLKYLIHRSLLNIYLTQGRVSDSNKKFKELIALKPTDYKSRYQYGLFLAKKKEFDNALNQLHEAQKLKPEDKDIKEALGVIYLRTKKFERAREYLKHIESFKFIDNEMLRRQHKNLT